jgi:hypothetical protein
LKQQQVEERSPTYDCGRKPDGRIRARDSYDAGIRGGNDSVDLPLVEQVRSFHVAGAIGVMFGLALGDIEGAMTGSLHTA